MPLLGVISDTHGLLRDSVCDQLQSVDLIIHAGDIGDQSILDALKEIAPVMAVRGNVDKGSWAEKLPLTEVISSDGNWIYLLHILEELSLEPQAAGMSMVIHGHRHKPEIVSRDGVIYLNPGSAGPKRSGDIISMALIHVEHNSLTPEIITLEE